MKIQPPLKNEFIARLEQFASKLNETARQMVISDPHVFAEQVRRKGVELFAMLKSGLFFKERARSASPQFIRAKVKRKVIDNLEEEYLYPEVVEAVTDTLITAAKSDPHYRRSLGL